MCGEIDEEERFEGDLYQRFLAQSRALLERPRGRGDDLGRYLDGLLDAVLERCVADAEQSAPADAYRQVAMQSLVLARLAGFLAGHVALNEDPLRKLIEAAMLGYREAESPPERDHHGPGDGHHHHGDGHHHHGDGDHDHHDHHDHDHHGGHAHAHHGPHGAHHHHD